MLVKLTTGRSPLNYYVCIGEFPVREELRFDKTKWITIVIFSSNIIVFIATSVRIFIYERKVYSNPIYNNSFVKNFEKGMLINKTLTFVIGLILFTIIAVSMFNLARLRPPIANQYPNYMFFWIIHSVPPFIISSIGLLIVKQKESMRTELLRELKKARK